MANANDQCSERLHVVFVNGVFNTRDDANENLASLKTFLSSANIEYGILPFDLQNTHLAYNDTEGLLDVLEAISQKEEEKPHLFWSYLRRPFAAPAYAAELFVQAAKKALLGKRTEMLNNSFEELAENIITQKFGKILLIAHSQGNFFANSLTNAIHNSISLHWETEKQKLRLISIATPTANVSGEGSYTTLTSDGVIKLIPSALKANVSNSHPSPGLFDHEFSSHYLKGNNSSQQIQRQIETEIAKLAKVSLPAYPGCLDWFKKHVNPKKPIEDCLKLCWPGLSTSDWATISCGNYCSRYCTCNAEEF